MYSKFIKNLICLKRITSQSSLFKFVLLLTSKQFLIYMFAISYLICMWCDTFKRHVQMELPHGGL